MIIWISSYPKSGNTWLRTLISAYYYSEDGIFKEDLLKNITQFPDKFYFKDFDYNPSIVADTSKFWIEAQKKINHDKKIRFFKTHNFYGSINNINFTDKKNSLGCIYIVRDPRNVITSLKNHYELDYNEALKFMLSEKKYLCDFRNPGNFSDFQFISSWEKNYQTWKYQKDFPVKIVRYEDLLKDTNEVFRDLIKFINILLENNEKIKEKKFKNAISSTTFEKLKNYEKKKGFDEAVFSKYEKKKVPFFNLGPKNNWNKILDKNLQQDLFNIFSKNLTELGYS